MKERKKKPEKRNCVGREYILFMKNFVFWVPLFIRYYYITEIQTYSIGTKKSSYPTLPIARIFPGGLKFF